MTGIADEAIRFNGYPFLDKEDHQYNAPVAKVMRTDLHTLPVTGLNVRQLGTHSMIFPSLFMYSLVNVEDILENTTVKGYPIISPDTRRLLLGYIDAEELRFVLGACHSFALSNTLSNVHARRESTRHARCHS